MSEQEVPTAPEHGAPPSDQHPAVAAAERYAELVGAIIKPLREDVAALRADLGLANGQTRGVLHRLTDLEERVSRLELADTEPPGYVDSSEPGGEL